MSLRNIKKSKDIVNDLETRFMDGERLTIDNIIDEYIVGVGSVLGRMQAIHTTKNWIQTLKKRFTKTHNLWFGNLNDENQYGLPATEAEYKYSMTQYYIRIKGVMMRAVQLKNEAASAGLLVGDETIYLPKLKNQED